MTNAQEEGEGVETSATICDIGWRGVRNIVMSHKSSHNKYDSVQSWLDFSYFSYSTRQFAAVDGRVKGGRS